MMSRDLSEIPRMAASTEEEFLTPKEAAKFLKMSTSFLAKKRMHGSGPTYSEAGRAIRYSKAALLCWLKSRERQSTKDELDGKHVQHSPSISPEIAD